MNEHQVDNLSPYQKKCLAILLEFDRVCTEHSVRYYLLAGTTLGAVRHGGFIPWDDDIDVGVPREDYKKLLALGNTFSSPYSLEYFTVKGTYKLPFAKVFDCSTTAIEQMEKPFRRGVWIDVFPLDGTFDNRALQFLHLQTINVLNRVFSFNVGRYPIKERITFRSKLRSFLTPIARLIPIRITNWALHKVVALMPFERSNYVGNFLGIYGVKEIVRAESIRGPSKKLNFCGSSLPAPSDPHAYLTALYGDYMTPPPPERRVGHRLLFVDLEMPYKESES